MNCGIGASGEQDPDDFLMRRTFLTAQRSVKGRLPSIGKENICIRSLFNQIFAQPPMAMESRAIEIAIGAKFIE